MTTSPISGAAAAAPFFGAINNKVNAHAMSVTPAASLAPAAPAAAAAGGNSLSGANLGTTFLSLLVQEMKNQDPTQPMDPTAMVGQMISLNQLDQLININQNLTPTPAPSTAPVSHSVAAGNLAAQQVDTKAALAAFTPNTVAALDPSQIAASIAGNQAATTATLGNQNPANPSTPLNLGNLNLLLGGK